MTKAKILLSISCLFTSMAIAIGVNVYASRMHRAVDFVYCRDTNFQCTKVYGWTIAANGNFGCVGAPNATTLCNQNIRYKTGA